jgi:hypothetical protein
MKSNMLFISLLLLHRFAYGALNRPRQNKFPNILCDRKVKFLLKFACHQQSVGENKETHSSQ